MTGKPFCDELLRLVEKPRPCSYLPDQTASLEYRLYASLTAAELESLIVRGWRRFGPQVFRPACRRCQECVSLRIDVGEFRSSKSQRRIWRNNGHVTVSIAPATVTAEHVELYNAWHRDMAHRRGWPLHLATIDSYAESFLAGRFPSLHEMRYREGGRLIGIGLVDLLPHSLSSAYFYHDPRWRPLGPGTFSGLCEIEYARRLQLAHVYFGYWIQGCPSMSYKNRFKPYETLQGRPGDDEPPVWVNDAPGRAAPIATIGTDPSE